MKKRLLSIVLSVCMICSMVPTAAFVPEEEATVLSNALECTYHIEHNEECGYVQAVTEQPCSHEHDEVCSYQEVTVGTPAQGEVPCDKECIDTDDDGSVDHLEGCAYIPSVEETPEVEGIPCAHEHDEACGYVEATAGSPCVFVCVVCNPLLPQEKECICTPIIEGDGIHTNMECPLYVPLEECICNPQIEGEGLHQGDCPLFVVPQFDGEPIFYVAPPAEDADIEVVKLNENGTVLSDERQPSVFSLFSAPPAGALYEYNSGKSPNMGKYILSTQAEAADITAVVNIPDLSVVQKNNTMNISIVPVTNVVFSVRINGIIPNGAYKLQAGSNQRMTTIIPVNLSALREGDNIITIEFEETASSQMMALVDAYLLINGGPSSANITEAFTVKGYDAATTKLQLYSKISDMQGNVVFQYLDARGTMQEIRSPLNGTQDFYYEQTISTSVIDHIFIYDSNMRAAAYLAKKFEVVDNQLHVFDISGDVTPQISGESTQKMALTLNKIFPEITITGVTSDPVATWVDTGNGIYTTDWASEKNPAITIAYTLNGEAKSYIYRGLTSTLDLTPPIVTLSSDIAVLLNSTTDDLTQKLNQAVLSYTDSKNPTPTAITFDIAAVKLDKVGDYIVTVSAKDGMGNEAKSTISVHVQNVPPTLSAPTFTPDNNDTTPTKTFSQTVDNFGTGTVTGYGFVVGYTPQPTLENPVFSAQTSGSPADKTFTATIEELKPNIQYYVRGYLTIDGQTTYSDPTPFSCGKPINFGALTADTVSLTHNGESTTGKIVVTRPSDSEGSVSANYVLDTLTDDKQNISLTGGNNGIIIFAADEFKKEIPFTIADTDEFPGYRSFGVTFSNFEPTSFNSKTDTATVSVVYNTRKPSVLEPETICLLEGTMFHTDATLNYDEAVGSGQTDKGVTWTSSEGLRLVRQGNGYPHTGQSGYTDKNNKPLSNWYRLLDGEVLTFTIDAEAYLGYQLSANFLTNAASDKIRIMIKQFDRNGTDLDKTYTSKSTNRYDTKVDTLCYRYKGGSWDPWGHGSIAAGAKGMITVAPAAKTIEVTLDSSGGDFLYPTLLAFKQFAVESYGLTTPTDGSVDYKVGDTIYLAPVFNSKIAAPTADYSITFNSTQCDYSVENGGFAYTLKEGDLGKIYSVSDMNTYYIFGKDESNAGGNEKIVPNSWDVTLPSAPTDTIGITIPNTDISGKPSYTVTPTFTNVGEVKKYEYAWFASASAPVNGWTTQTIGEPAYAGGYDGEMNLHVRAVNARGKYTYASQKFTFVPSTASFSINPAADVGNWWTTTNKATVTITKSARVSVKLSINGTTATEVAGDTYEITQSGSYTFIATYGENFTKQQTFDVNFDFTEPDITVSNNIYKTGVDYTALAGITVAFDDGIGGSGIDAAKTGYAWTNSNATPADSAFEAFSGGQIPEQTTAGTWYLHLRAVDKAGNIAEGMRLGGYTVVPVAAKNPPAVTASISDAGIITYSVTKGANNYTVLLPDGTKKENQSGNLTVQTCDVSAKGNGVYTIVAVDTKGNVGQASVVLNGMDKEAPLVSLSARDKDGANLIPGTLTNKKDFTIQVEVNDKLSPVFKDDGTNLNPTSYTGSGLKSLTWKMASGAETSLMEDENAADGKLALSKSFGITQNGTYTITATDNKDNTTTQTITVSSIDTTAPVVTVTNDTLTEAVSEDWENTAQTITVKADDNGSDNTLVSSNVNTITVNVYKYNTTTEKYEKSNTLSKVEIITDSAEGETTLTLSASAQYKLEITSADKLGNTADTITKYLNLDVTDPVITASYQSDGKAYTSNTWVKKDVVVTLANSANNVSDTTYYVSNNGGTSYIEVSKATAIGAWDADAKTFTISTDTNATFKFKAVSGAELEKESTSHILKVQKTVSNPYAKGDITPDKIANIDEWYKELPTLTVTKREAQTNHAKVTTYYKLWKSTEDEPADTAKVELAGTTISISSDAKWKLKIWTEDEAANTTTAYEGEYQVDITKPTDLVVKYSTDKVFEALNKVTFGHFFKETTKVTFTAKDALSGVKSFIVTLNGKNEKGEAVTTQTVLTAKYNKTTDTYSADFNLEPQYTGYFNVVVTDTADNATDAKDYEQYMVEGNVPTLDITAIGAKDVNATDFDSRWQGKITLTLTAKEPAKNSNDELQLQSGIDKIVYTVQKTGGATATEVTVSTKKNADGTGPDTFSVTKTDSENPTLALTENGTYTITAKAYDMAGSFVSVTKTVMIDVNIDSFNADVESAVGKTDLTERRTALVKLMNQLYRTPINATEGDYTDEQRSHILNTTLQNAVVKTKLEVLYTALSTLIKDAINSLNGDNKTLDNIVDVYYLIYGTAEDKPGILTILPETPQNAIKIACKTELETLNGLWEQVAKVRKLMQNYNLLLDSTVNPPVLTLTNQRRAHIDSMNQYYTGSLDDEAKALVPNEVVTLMEQNKAIDGLIELLEKLPAYSPVKAEEIFALDAEIAQYVNNHVLTGELLNLLTISDQQKLRKLQGDVSAAKTVSEQITLLDASSDAQTIQNAYHAYLALTADQKLLIATELQKKLTDLAAVLDAQALLAPVMALIDTAMAEPSDTNIVEAKTAYDSLPANVRSQLSKEYQDKIINLTTAQKLMQQIDSLKPYTTNNPDDRQTIPALQKAYDAANAQAKALIEKRTTVDENVSISYKGCLEVFVADLAAANAINERLTAIDNSTDKTTLEALKAGYESITGNQKRLVPQALLEKLSALLLKLDKDNVLTGIHGKIDALPAPELITKEGADGKPLDEIYEAVAEIERDITAIVAAGLKRQDVDSVRLNHLDEVTKAITATIQTEVERLHKSISDLPETLDGQEQAIYNAVKELYAEIQALPRCIQNAIASADKAKLDLLLSESGKLRKVILDSTSLEVSAPDLLTVVPTNTVNDESVSDLARVDVILTISETSLSDDSLAYMTDLLIGKQQIGVMLDISLLKRAVNEGVSGTDIERFEEKVSQLGSPIAITLTLPKEISNGSNFAVLSRHGNDTYAKAIPATNLGNKLTFYAQEFSDYAIVYTPYTATGSESGSDSGLSSHDKAQSDFWQTVKKMIEESKRDDLIKIDAKDYDQMPWNVMEALRKGHVTLVIDWNGGETITIPAGQAQVNEAGRIYWPLSRLLELYKNAKFVETDKTNPITGGAGYIEYTNSGKTVAVSGSFQSIEAPTAKDTPTIVTPPTAGIDTTATSYGAVMTVAAILFSLAACFLLWRRRHSEDH